MSRKQCAGPGEGKRGTKRPPRDSDGRVSAERGGDVLGIMMKRHAKPNAVDAAMAAALDAALNDLDDDPGLRVGILAVGPDMC